MRAAHPHPIFLRVPPPGPTVRQASLFTDPLFSLKSSPSARDKNKNSGELNDRYRRGVGVGEEGNCFCYFSFRPSAVVVGLADYQRKER